MTAAGEVSDYDEATINQMENAVANSAGVHPANVSITVAAASVRLTVLVATHSSNHSAEVAESLQNDLGDAASASAFFANAGTNITVTSAPAFQVITPAPSPPPSPSSPVIQELVASASSALTGGDDDGATDSNSGNPRITSAVAITIVVAIIAVALLVLYVSRNLLSRRFGSVQIRRAGEPEKKPNQEPDLTDMLDVEVEEVTSRSSSLKKKKGSPVTHNVPGFA